MITWRKNAMDIWVIMHTSAQMTAMTIGKIDLKVLRTRSGEFSTDVFEKYERCDQALILSMLEMVVNGVSTRKIANITKRLYGETVSKSTVSKLTEKLNPIVKEWSNR